jgi:hypothetical protein
MLRHIASNHLAPVPPWADTRASRDRRSTAGEPSAVSFVAVTLVAAIALIFSLVLIVTAPATVTLPLGIAFVVGAVSSALAVKWDRRRRGRHRPRAFSPPSPLRTSADSEPVGLLHGASDEDRRGFGWGAVGAVSMLLLVSALIVPESIGILFMAIGLAGLMMFRLAAMSRGWAPRGISSASASAAGRDGTVGGRATGGIREVDIDDALEMTFPASDPPAWSFRPRAPAGHG